MTKRKTPFFFTFKGLSNSPIFQYLNFSFHRHFKGFFNFKPQGRRRCGVFTPTWSLGACVARSDVMEIMPAMCSM